MPTTPERSTEERMTALAATNHGATTALTILKNAHADKIGELLGTLEKQGIVGPDIWRLYNDVCGQSHEKMVDALRDGTASEKLHAA